MKVKTWRVAVTQPYNAIPSPNNSKQDISKSRDGIWVKQHKNSKYCCSESTQTFISTIALCKRAFPQSPASQPTDSRDKYTGYFNSQHHISVVPPVLTPQ